MTGKIIAIVAGLLMLFGTPWAVTPASGQATGGAFQQLSPGNQKAVRALHEAQRPDLRPGTRLTLDQIASLKQSGQGWSRIFDGMKGSGLIEGRNFGEVVQAFNARRQAQDPAGTTVASAGERPEAASGEGERK
jgi:hypothetical protein